MKAFSSLRLWLYRLRARYSKKPAKKVYVEEPGLPPGLDYSDLEAATSDWLDGKIRSVSYIHLSGWKSTGAFRLILSLTSGSETTLIYKNAIYGLDEIPALREFPIQPGLPEYVIYSQPVGALADFLPQVFLVEEVHPGKQYRYLLEDLRPGFRIMKSESDKLTASCLLPRLHTALQDWSEKANPSGLLQYNQQFSSDLQAYAFRNLELYSQRVQNPLLKSLLLNWPGIARVHLSPEFFIQPVALIHGDTNYSNIHVSKTDPDVFKVVDWEWAGIGSPHADLASLLKGTPPELEKNAFEKFVLSQSGGASSRKPRGSSSENWRLYLWCSLERGMIDAAFLSAQHLQASHRSRLNMPDAISNSINRVMTAYRKLSSN